MRKEDGFSLIELLIVVAIIGVVSALALPQLRNARQAARAGSAVQSLRTITTAEHLFFREGNVYGTFATLAPTGTLDSSITSGSKSGYGFALAVVNRGVGISNGFEANATPLEDPALYRHFFVDETGVIRYSDGAPATAASPPIPK